jgi:hypothetical protein
MKFSGRRGIAFGIPENRAIENFRSTRQLWIDSATLIMASKQHVSPELAMCVVCGRALLSKPRRRHHRQLCARYAAARHRPD